MKSKSMKEFLIDTQLLKRKNKKSIVLHKSGSKEINTSILEKKKSREKKLLGTNNASTHDLVVTSFLAFILLSFMKP